MNAPGHPLLSVGQIGDPPGSDRHELPDAGVVDALVDPLGIHDRVRERIRHSRRVRPPAGSLATRPAWRRGAGCRAAMGRSRRATRLRAPAGERIPVRRWRRRWPESPPRARGPRWSWRSGSWSAGALRWIGARGSASTRVDDRVDLPLRASERSSDSRQGSASCHRSTSCHGSTQARSRVLSTNLPCQEPAGLADGLALCATPTCSAIRPCDHADRCGSPAHRPRMVR